MGILPDRVIKYFSTMFAKPMIIPYYAKQAAGGQIPFGQSSFGYDIRVGNVFETFAVDTPDGVIDPKAFDPKLLRRIQVEPHEPVLLPPYSFTLAWAMEELFVPRNVLVVCLGKSTYARCGLIVNVTPAEPEWQGHLTLELHNTTPLWIKVYACEGIAQLIFLEGEECAESYADRNGRYMNQEARVVYPSVRTR